MAFTAPTEASMLVALKRLQGTGYADDDASTRVRELAAIAVIAAIGSSDILRAALQAWPRTADDLLQIIEAARGLRNSAARTLDQRRDRIEAVLRGDGRASKIVAALAHIGVSATLYRNTRAMIAGPVSTPITPTIENLPEESIYQLGVLVSDADFDDFRTRQTILDVLEKILPGHSQSHMGEQSIDGPLATHVGPRWGTSDQLDRMLLWQGEVAIPDVPPISPLIPYQALDPNTAGSRKLRIRHPSRLKPYGPLSKLRSFDLNALQDNLLFGCAGATGQHFTNAVGGMWQAVSMRTAFGNKDLDVSAKWTDRFVLFVGRISASDIRPGGPAFFGLNALTTPVYAFGYTGVGQTGTGPNNSIPIDANAYLFADSSSSNRGLRIRDLTPGGRYIVGMLIASPACNGRDQTVGPYSNEPQQADNTVARRMTSFASQDTVPSISWFNAMVSHSHIRAASGSSYPSPAGVQPVGGVHRTGVVANLQRKASGTNTVVLDSTVDWRDRLLVLSYRLNSGLVTEPQMIPGSYPDYAQGFYDVLFGYTGLGEVLGNVTYDKDVHFGAIPIVPHTSPLAPVHVIVFANSATGELMLQVDQVSFGADWVTVFLDIHATEQTTATGAHVAPPTIPNSTDGDVVLPYDLDALQDGAISTQLRQGDPTVQNKYARVYASPQDMTFPPRAGTWPLGPIGIRPANESRTDPNKTDAQLDILLPAGVPDSTPKNLGNAIVPLQRNVGNTLSSVRVSLPEASVSGSPSTYLYKAEAAFVRRQNVAGGVRIFFSVPAIPTGNIAILDDTVDWRDRLLTCCGAVLTDSASAPGGSADDAFYQNAQLFSCGYTGEGFKHLIAIGNASHFLFVDEYRPTRSVKRGRLCLAFPATNQHGIVGMIWASFQFGCSQRAETRLLATTP